MKLKDDLYTVIQSSGGKDKHDFTIRLNPEHFIYQAHFPGEPITPGVCIMQIAKELLEEATSLSLTLNTVKNIKFLKVISPSEVQVVEYSLAKIVREDNIVKVQVSVHAGEELYAKLSLSCQTTE